MSQSFSAFCESLGLPLHNKYWSWCAHSEDEQIAIFTVWEDRIESGVYPFTTKPRPGESPNKPGRKELVKVLNRAIEHGYTTYGIQCRANDINAIPRKRKSFRNDELLDLRVYLDSDDYFARISGRIPPNVARSRGAQSTWAASAAINDLQDEESNDDPEYKLRMSGSYKRDEKVRRYVIKRADGCCEYCGNAGFKKPDGSVYIETHHVISLSEQGADKRTNVIGLCPNDHRRAHFASDWKELQDEFLSILARKEG